MAIIDIKLPCHFELTQAKHLLKYRLLFIPIGGTIIIYLKSAAEEQ